MNDATSTQVEAAPLSVDMVGAVPTRWGGGAKWRGGGVASHIQGLLSVLPANGVRVRLLADNTDASQRPSFPDASPSVQYEAMARTPGDLLGLGACRLARIALRMAADREVRTCAPPAQVLRFWAQAVNYDRFLSGSPADVVHIHRAFNRQYLCQRVVGIAVPMVVTVHSVNLLVQSSPEWVGRMVKLDYERACWMIAVSHFVKDQIVGYGADPARITVITNGVNVALFSPRPRLAARQELGLPPDDFIVLFSGNLIPRKGVDVLLNAFGQCEELRPRARLVVVGQGEESARLEAQAVELGIASRVTFAGPKPFAEMPLWYQACDVFVMPSWAEGLSMAILEAMASGRPVITSRTEVGKHDAVIPDETGFLTGYGNVEELARAIERLSTSSELARRLGNTARRMVEGAFSWDLVGRRTAEVYRLAHQARQA